MRVSQIRARDLVCDACHGPASPAYNVEGDRVGYALTTVCLRCLAALADETARAVRNAVAEADHSNRKRRAGA